jgi:hypothetical protein
VTTKAGAPRGVAGLVPHLHNGTVSPDIAGATPPAGTMAPDRDQVPVSTWGRPFQRSRVASDQRESRPVAPSGRWEVGSRDSLERR